MEKENVPFKHEVKKTFTEFMTTTPIHGLPQLMNTKTWYMKIFWIIFIGALFGFGIWLVVKAITDYLEHPVVSEVQENIETQMEFPAVTFCNLDPFATQYAIDHVEAKLISVFNLSMNDLIQPTWATYSNLKKYQNFILNDISDPSYNVSTKQKFGVSLDKTLIDCHYNEESCLDTMANNFIWYYSYRYGNCFTFNSGYTFNTTQPDETSIKNEIPIKLVKKAGPLFGLNFEIFTGVDKSSFSMKTYGAILFIHKQTSKPESKPDSTGVILLKPGTYSDIAIKKSFTTQVPDPYSDCQDLSSFKFDRKYFNILNNEGIKYNQQDCLDLCMQQEIIDKCNCYFLEFFKLDNQTKACLSMDEVNCAYTNYEKFAEKDTVEVCKNQCPLECDSLEYDFTISSSGYPSNGYAEILKSYGVIQDHFNTTNITNEQLKNDILSVNIYFNDFLNVETIHSRKMTEIDLLANIGGTFGLCIGLSLTCIVQIIFILIEIIKIFIFKIRNRS